MKRMLIAVLMSMLMLGIASCCKSKRCKPVVRVSYMVPEFACPVPTDPVLKSMSPDDFYISQDQFSYKNDTNSNIAMIPLSEHDRVAKNLMEKQGENIINLVLTIKKWKDVYKYCIDSIIELYKNEAIKNEKEDIDAER